VTIIIIIIGLVKKCGGHKLVSPEEYSSHCRSFFDTLYFIN